MLVSPIKREQRYQFALHTSRDLQAGEFCMFQMLVDTKVKNIRSGTAHTRYFMHLIAFVVESEKDRYD